MEKHALQRKKGVKGDICNPNRHSETLTQTLVEFINHRKTLKGIENLDNRLPIPHYAIYHDTSIITYTADQGKEIEAHCRLYVSPSNLNPTQNVYSVRMAPSGAPPAAAQQRRGGQAPFSPAAWPMFFDQGGNTVFFHPYAFRPGGIHNNNNNNFNVAEAAAAAAAAAANAGVGEAVGGEVGPATKMWPIPVPPIPDQQQHQAAGGNREYRVSQAAQQLHNQIAETKKVFSKFHSNFGKDVERIRGYASDGLLHRLWEDKVRHNRRGSGSGSSGGKGKSKDAESDNLVYQHDKLSTCLKRMAKATTLFPDAASAGLSQESYDSRELLFEKIRAAGDRVQRLCERVWGSEGACGDLVSELGELMGLVDPKKRGAKGLLYRKGGGGGGGDGDGDDDKSDGEKWDDEGDDFGGEKNKEEDDGFGGGGGGGWGD